MPSMLQYITNSCHIEQPNPFNGEIYTYIVLGTGVKKQAKDNTLDFTFSLKLVYCVLNRFMVCIEWVSLVYCMGAFYVLGGCFS